MEPIGQRILRIIKEQKMNQSEFAKSLQITPASVSTMISGKTNPSAQTIQQICDKYGYDPEWLKTGGGNPKRAKPRQEQLSAAFARALAGTSVSANLISSIALALDRLDDDHAAAIVDLLTEIVKGYGNLEIVEQSTEKNTAAARSGDRMEVNQLGREEEESVLPPPYTGDI